MPEMWRDALTAAGTHDGYFVAFFPSGFGAGLALVFGLAFAAGFGLAGARLGLGGLDFGASASTFAVTASGFEVVGDRHVNLRVVGRIGYSHS